MSTMPAAVLEENALQPPPVVVESPEAAPVRVIKSGDLTRLGQELRQLFERYRSDRRIAELKWLRNLRQYLGIYDPDIESLLSKDRSRAYPRLTRVKCISVLSRIMNMMFPGNERNWALDASPSAEMDPAQIERAIVRLAKKYKDDGIQPVIDEEFVETAAQQLSEEQAEKLSKVIDDQLTELGGDQTLDYVSLNRKVLQSGIMYGLGLLRGPFVRTVKRTVWRMDGMTGQPAPQEITLYKPQYEFQSLWDCYMDMSAKSIWEGDGYFIRKVFGRAQFRKLADRPNFFADQVRTYLQRFPNGNYKEQSFEQELRTMGVATNVNTQKAEGGKFEVIVWHGPVSGELLRKAGVEVADDRLADDIDAEIWMIDDVVISADMNVWRSLGVEVRNLHAFLFDEDDTSPVGSSLPDVMRDSQMSVAASVRMMLDNASVVCGPIMELNTDLLRQDQDISSVHAYKIFYREGMDAAAQYPAVRQINVDGHLGDLKGVAEMFMQFADMETFVGPATGGDMGDMPSEPMRTAAGASMLRGDNALPFKDIIRNFDVFTQSVILSLVRFNEKFNPNNTPKGDFNVIARGATSLMAKEVRGIQVDTLAQTMTPSEWEHIDERKFAKMRLSVRDLEGLMLSEDEVMRKKAMRAQAAQETEELQKELVRAEIREVLTQAFKNVTQGQKNSASADAAAVNSAVELLMAGMDAQEPAKGGKKAA